MKYSNIPAKVLEIELGETYDGCYTLKDELAALKEDIIATDYELITYGNGEINIKYMKVWTKSQVAVLVDSGLGDQILIILPKNPPKKQ